MGPLTRVGRRAAALYETMARRCARSRLSRFALGRHLIDLILLPTDVRTIRRTYKKQFGVYPRLAWPGTFNEFLQQSKVVRRDARKTMLADKVRVREYVADRIGDQYLTRLYWTGTDLVDVDRATLPRAFMLKANHGYAFNLAVRDQSQLDWSATRATTQSWLATDHSARHAEWQYRWIPRRLLAEELLLEEDGSLPTDFKFFCFRGRAMLCQIDFGRARRHTRSFYDKHFNLVPMTFQYPRHEGEVEPPRSYAEMWRLSEALAEGMDFVRVDFYDVAGPVFGELTFCPGGGLNRFSPEEWNVTLGRWVRSGSD